MVAILGDVQSRPSPRVETAAGGVHLLGVLAGPYRLTTLIRNGAALRTVHSPLIRSAASTDSENVALFSYGLVGGGQVYALNDDGPSARPDVLQPTGETCEGNTEGNNGISHDDGTGSLAAAHTPNDPPGNVHNSRTFVVLVHSAGWSNESAAELGCWGPDAGWRR